MDERLDRLLNTADSLGSMDDGLVTEAVKPVRRRFPWGETIASVLAVIMVLGSVFGIMKLAGNRSPIGTPGNESDEPSVTTEPAFRPKWMNTSSPGDAVPEATQVPTYGDRQVFYSQEELEEWILGGPHDEPKDVLYGLSYYYVPEKLPDEAEFQYIEADPDMVWVHYELNFENNFSLGFYKDPSKRIDLHATAGVVYTEIDTGSKDVYIIDHWLYKTACWEQDGHVLQLNVPAYYEEETIIGYCSAVREILPAAPKPDSRFMFHTEKSFFDAISGNIPETSALYGLNGYWALYDPPADRDAISVMEVDDSEVILFYGPIVDHTIESMTFSYLRDTKPDELEDYLHPAGSLSSVTQYGDVFMTEWEYSGRYGGGLEFYWHQGEDCFCIRFTWDFERPEFTEEEVKALCRAGFVTDPAPAGEAAVMPEPTICPGQHGDLAIVFEGENGERYEISALCRTICRSTSHADGSLMEEAHGCTLPYCYEDVRDQLPAIETAANISISPPDCPGYERDPVELITAYTENAEGSLEEFREFDSVSALERFINAERDARDELIVEIIVRFTDRYDYSNGSLSSGLEGWAFKLIPCGAEPEPTPEAAGGLVIMATDENGAVNEILPYRHMLWSTVDLGSDPESGQGSALQADGWDLYSLLPEIRDKLPVLYADSEIELVLPEDYPCTLTEIQVFGVAENDTAETIRLADAAELMEFMRTFDWNETDRLAVDILLKYSDRPFENGERTGTAKGCDGYALWISRPETAVTPEETPSPDVGGVSFMGGSIEALIDTLKMVEGGPESPTEFVEGIYVPVNLPEGSSIEIAAAEPTRVYLRYRVEPAWDAEEDDPAFFELIWHRDIGADEAEELVDRIISECGLFDECVRSNGVWIIRSFDLTRRAVWVSERGDVLEVVYPSAFADDSDALSFAQAEWLPIR